MRKTNTTRLGVERLDERDVPACIVAFAAPDTLVITGNGAADSVVLYDHGNGVVTGGATGWGAFGFAGIKHIKVDTGAGNDRVLYYLMGNMAAGRSQTLDVSLGSGADTFYANLFNRTTGVGSDLKAGSSLVISANGGRENDRMGVNAQYDTDVGVQARLLATLVGETGNDIITGYYRGENDGFVGFRNFNGGIGDDIVRGYVKEDAGSTGYSFGSVYGEDGKDALALVLLSANPATTGILDGGAGLDTGIATPNVTVLNVP
jgi:hypothetical protein